MRGTCKNKKETKGLEHIFDYFEIEYENHEKEARQILFDSKIVSVERLACSNSKEIEELINQNFEAIKYKRGWILIPIMDRDDIIPKLKIIEKE